MSEATLLPLYSTDGHSVSSYMSHLETVIGKHMDFWKL